VVGEREKSSFCFAARKEKGVFHPLLRTGKKGVGDRNRCGIFHHPYLGKPLSDRLQVVEEGTPAFVFPFEKGGGQISRGEEVEV